MGMTEQPVKIAFEVSGQNDSGIEVERLWAKPVQDDVYEIDNSPYQVYGISWGDKVEATKLDSELKFVRVVARSGHSTYRIRLPCGRDHSYFLQYWPELEVLGCTYEGADGERRLYSIDVPSANSVSGAYSILQRLENSGVWEFEEAHYYRPEGN